MNVSTKFKALEKIAGWGFWNRDKVLSEPPSTAPSLPPKGTYPVTGNFSSNSQLLSDASAKWIAEHGGLGHLPGVPSLGEGRASFILNPTAGSDEGIDLFKQVQDAGDYPTLVKNMTGKADAVLGVLGRVPGLGKYTQYVDQYKAPITNALNYATYPYYSNLYARSPTNPAGQKIYSKSLKVDPKSEDGKRYTQEMLNRFAYAMRNTTGGTVPWDTNGVISAWAPTMDKLRGKSSVYPQDEATSRPSQQ